LNDSIPSLNYFLDTPHLLSAESSLKPTGKKPRGVASRHGWMVWTCNRPSIRGGDRNCDSAGPTSATFPTARPTSVRPSLTANGANIVFLGRPVIFVQRLFFAERTLLPVTVHGISCFSPASRRQTLYSCCPGSAANICAAEPRERMVPTRQQYY
jgi:hypothetical protein